MKNLQQEFFNIRTDFDATIPNYSTKIEALRKNILDNLPYFKVLSPRGAKDITEFISPLEAIANEIRSNFDDLIIVSMGGANLNPASLITAVGPSDSSTRIHFLYRTEETDLNSVLNKVDLAKCAVLMISKSGGTLETISISAALIQQYKQAGVEDLAKHFYFLSKKDGGKIANLAMDLGATIIPHDQGVGGRYSGLDNVSILPALIAGIDVTEYLQGANRVLESFLEDNNHPALHSAIAMYEMNKPILVNVAYQRKLNIFLRWVSQIIAESLGKKGQGFTPLISMGPEDQHSMFQLYLDGPEDKFYSYYAIENKSDNQSFKIADMPAQLGKIAGMTLNEIHKINEDASFTALRKINRPMRKITLPDRSVGSIGELIAFSMLEVVFLGTLMGINPFDQDGVELIKRESRAVVE